MTGQNTITVGTDSVFQRPGGASAHYASEATARYTST